MPNATKSLSSTDNTDAVVCDDVEDLRGMMAKSNGLYGSRRWAAGPPGSAGPCRHTRGRRSVGPYPTTARNRRQRTQHRGGSNWGRVLQRRCQLHRMETLNVHRHKPDCIPNSRHFWRAGEKAPATGRFPRRAGGGGLSGRSGPRLSVSVSGRRGSGTGR